MSAAGEDLPKPLVEVGGRPILWHVMSLYAAQGFRSFVLCLGHGGDRVGEQISALAQVDAVERPEPPANGRWGVVFAETGLETPTGGRVARVAPLVEDGTFFLTYADGVADIDLHALLSFHRRHGGLATMTVVRPREPFGVADLEGDRVVAYREKPRLEHWVNGGFLCMEPGALSLIGAEDVLERAPFEALAGRGDLFGFRHEGFWDCMDTYKDTLLLNELWERGEAPWRAVVGV